MTLQVCLESFPVLTYVDDICLGVKHRGMQNVLFGGGI